jgi:pimeloyl-ACP methyl ester carboxylesterase
MKEPRPTLLALGPYGQPFWADMQAHLPASIDVVVDDLRDGDDCGVLAARIAARAPARFALLGFCMGGYVAFELLRSLPRRISRLALVNTTARADTAPQAAIRAQRVAKLRGKCAVTPYPDDGYLDQAVPWLLSATSFGSPARVRAVRELLTGIPLSCSADQQQAMLERADSRALLPAIAVPALIIAGREDRIVPLLHAREMGAAIAGASVHILEHCGHLAPIEAPAELGALVARWMAPELESWTLEHTIGERHAAAG